MEGTLRQYDSQCFPDLGNPLGDCLPRHYHESQVNMGFNVDIGYDFNLINKEVYLDQEDQSAWLYLKWLNIVQHKDAMLREMYVSKSLEAVVLIFSEPVSRNFIEQYVLNVRHSEGMSSTKSGRLDHGDVTHASIMNGGNSVLVFSSVLQEPQSFVWTVSLAGIELFRHFSVELRSMTKENFLWQCNVESSMEESLIRVDTDIHRMIWDNVSNIVSSPTLSNELSVMRDLLHSDPTNKLFLLAIVSLLRLLSPLESREEILDILSRRLPLIDQSGTHFYRDAASKFSIECHLNSLYHSSRRHVHLSSCHLTSLSHLPWMSLMTEIDLSHNRLSSLPDTFRHYLLCVSRLNLSHNHLDSLLPLQGLQSLTHLDVSFNLLATFHDLEPIFHCTHLLCLDIKGNMVSQLPNLTDLVIGHPTSKLHMCSLKILYTRTL